jgi:hypothetical protein
MTNAARVAGAVLLAVAVWVGPGAPGTGLGPRAAQAAEDWKKEFEDVCAKTQDAMALPTDELKALVVRCDALKPTIEALDESARKVYSRRLKACRDLYQYVLDYREQGQG